MVQKRVGDYIDLGEEETECKSNLLLLECVDVSDHVFFFQAEDGIRDYKVTGVQTCALPIFVCQVRSTFRASVRPLPRLIAGCVLPEDHGERSTHPVRQESGYQRLSRRCRNARSEERRVGKECRSRWSPYH